MLRPVFLVCAVLALVVVASATPGISRGLAPLPKDGNPRVASSLRDVLDTYEEYGATEALVFASDRGVRVHQDRLRVMVEAFEGREQAAEIQIEESLGLIEQRWRRWFQVSTTVPNLKRLTEGDAIRFIDQARDAQPQVVSEGVGVIGANTWHSGGINGAGVKLAIIDGGFASYTTKLGTELPASVTAVSMRADGLLDATDHGTAVAEIAYDTAPGAQLFLIATDTQIGVAMAVDYANAQGVKVINFSAGYLGDGNGDGSGIINAVVDAATSTYGMVWVSASGNYGEEHWGGVWSDPDSNFFHNFAGTDETNDIFLFGGESVSFYLTWNDPWTASCNNWDLRIYNSLLSLVASSTNVQDCNTAPPLETIHFLAPYTDNFHVVIYRFWTFTASTFDLFAANHVGLQYQTPTGSLTPPADNSNALTVGAVGWFAPNTIEPYSSQGPTTDGRTKPDLVAPDGVSTATSGAFFGTSASAPHAAGAAALVLQLNPCYTRTQVQSFLEGAAVSLGSPGKDNVFGSGRLSMGTLPTTSCAADADGDSIPDSTDNCPNWHNPSQQLPPWPVPSGDPDCDGTSSADEALIGTDPTEACPLTVGVHDAWPADFDMNRTISTTDVFQVLPPFLGTSVPPTDARRDLVPNGTINITDVFKVLPPFWGSSCSP